MLCWAEDALPLLLVLQELKHGQKLLQSVCRRPAQAAEARGLLRSCEGRGIPLMSLVLFSNIEYYIEYSATLPGLCQKRLPVI